MSRFKRLGAVSSKEPVVPNLVMNDLPETGSFEIIRASMPAVTGAMPLAHAFPALPTTPIAPVLIDTSWHGRHGISRFSAEVLRRLKLPRTFVPTDNSPTSPTDVIAPWRRRLKASDVVYTPGFNAGLTRARQVLTLHDLIHLADRNEASLAKRTYYERLVRPAVRRTGIVLTVSETSRTAIRDWLRDDDVDVVNVGNGCSELFFQPTAAKRDLSQMLYVGNLKHHKNPAPVFAALAMLPDAHLTLVTSDVDEAHRLAMANRVAGRVKVVGSCTDRELKTLYASAGVLVLPSLNEGFGLPAVEALSVGTPVVYWQGCASVAEIVGSHGVAVENAADGEEWAASIGAVLSGARGFQRPAGWQTRWSWDGVAARVDLALHGVASR